MIFDALNTSTPPAGSRLQVRVYGVAAALLALFLLTATPARAAVEVQLSPSPIAPQPVGTTITWTASAADPNPGTLEYQFSVRPPGGDFAVVRDFSPSNSFQWTPSEREGAYDIRVNARNATTKEAAQLFVSYSVSSRVSGDSPVVSATSNPLVALYSAPACDADSMRVRFWRAGDFSSRATP